MEQINKYNVIISERANEMLVSHAIFVAQINVSAALHLTSEFEKTANSLEFMPERCPYLKAEYLPKNTYRFIAFEKYYLLIYQIVEDNVFVDYVVDYRQNYEWLIR